MLAVFVLLGLSVGSFSNVCIDRLPARVSIVAGSSHCAQCLHPLGAADLVPVLSYLWLRGRCRYCGARIPFRLPVVELLSGGLFGLLYWRYDLSPEFGVALVYGTILLIIFLIDLEQQLILNVVVLPSLALALAGSFFWPDIGPLRALLGGAIGTGVLSIPYILYREGMGLGDVKLGMLLGLMVGYPYIFLALLLAVISSGLVAIILLALKIKGRKDPIPFAPFLTAGTFATLVWGPNILDWYSPWG